MVFKKSTLPDTTVLIFVCLSSLANLCNYFLKTLKSIPIPAKGLATSTTLTSGIVAIPFHSHMFCSLA